MPPVADLYIDRMNLEKYCAGDNCELCRVDSFEEFVERIKSGGMKRGTCPHWPAWKVEAFRQALQAETILPRVPSLDMPRPAATGLMEVVETDATCPVLVTGNSAFTQEVMLVLLAQTSSPIRLLCVDCLGHTVDMALVFGEFRPEKILSALKGIDMTGGTRIILPGLAQAVAREVEDGLGRGVEVGPVCAAELPLYMGSNWSPVE